MGSLPRAGAPAVTGDLDAGEPPTADASTGRPADADAWRAGDYPTDLMSDNWLEIKGLPGQKDTTRQFKVHVPPTYNPDKPTPVVFCFHGLGQDALLFCVSGADMPTKSDQAGFVLVMPNGYQNSWNAGTCCGGAVTDKLDDIGFIRAVFAEVAKHINIDRARVYSTGLSNGAYISYRLACEASDLFVAVAPGAGALGMDDIGGGTVADGDFDRCMPTQKVSVLELHGTQDPLIPYMLMKPTLDRMAMLNGCAQTTKPATQPASGGDTTCVTYDGCPAGIEVSGCSVEGGGHVWFGSPNCGTGVDAACAIVGENSKTLKNTDVVWEFFSRHSR